MASGRWIIPEPPFPPRSTGDALLGTGYALLGTGYAGSGDEIVARIANFLLFTNSTQSLISKEDWIELLICSRDVFLKPKNLTAAILERPPGRLRLYLITV